MQKEDTKQLSLLDVKKYDDNHSYFVFFDYNEGKRLIIHNDLVTKVLNICLSEKDCCFLFRESHLYSYIDLDIFTKILDKHHIDYKTEWFDIEY